MSSPCGAGSGGDVELERALAVLYNSGEYHRLLAAVRADIEADEGFRADMLARAQELADARGVEHVRLADVAQQVLDRAAANAGANAQRQQWRGLVQAALTRALDAPAEQAHFARHASQPGAGAETKQG